MQRPGHRRAVVVLVAVLLALVASAGTASAADPYTSKSPWTRYGTFRCIDSQVLVARSSIEGNDGPGRPEQYWGRVSLWKSNVCQSYWATVDFDFPMPANRYGIAQLTRIYGSSRANWTCDGAGGNKRVLPGQRSCYTGMVYAPSSAVTFYVLGDVRCPDGGWYACVRGQTSPAR